MGKNKIKIYIFLYLITSLFFFIFFMSENKRNAFSEPLITTILKSFIFGVCSLGYGIFSYFKTKFSNKKSNKL